MINKILVGVLLTMFFLPVLASATLYYVDASGGNDGWGGTSTSTPWKTISKVNSATFSPGDQVLFKRGETWREMLIIPSSGNSANQLTFGAYGTGAKPKILGSNLVNGWDQADIPGGGAADLLNEGFEATKPTNNGYDAAGWTEVKGAGSTVEPDSAAVARPLGGGNQCLQVIRAASQDVWASKDFGSEINVTYTTFYVRVEASNVGNDGGVTIVEARDDNYNTMWRLLWTKSGSTPKLSFFTDRNYWSYPNNASAASLGTWYKVGVKYDATSRAWEYQINDASVYTGSLGGTNYNGIRTLLFGGVNYHVPTFTAYYDSVNISTTGWPSIPSVPLPSGTWKARLSSFPYNTWFVEKNGLVSWGDRKTAMADCTNEYDYSWHSSGYLVVYSPTNPDTRYASVEPSMRRNGITNNGKSYITIQNLEVAYASELGIDVTSYASSNWLINGNTVHHIGGTDPYSACGIVCRASNSLVQNNTVHDCGIHGICSQVIDSNTVQNITIDSNEVYDCYHTGIDIQNIGSGGIIRNITISRNKVYDTANYAFPSRGMNGYYTQGGDTDADTVDSVNFYYNLAYNILGSGFQVNYRSKNINIYNNVFYGTHPLNSGQENGLIVGGDNYGQSNIRIKNNIAFDVHDYAFAVNDKSVVTECDNNAWYQSGAYGTIFALINFNPYYSGGQAAYKAYTGWDAHGKWADPKFINPSSSDFHLQSTSPAIDAGAVVGLTRDYEGNTVPQGSAPDIGAFEYSSVAGPKTYYVSTTGNDSNSGTQALPWRTIQKAANTMVAGDSVIVLAGNYSSQRVSVTTSGNAGLPITYQAQGTVIMKGFKIIANYITVKGFEIANTDYARWQEDISAGVYVQGNHVIVEDNYVHDCAFNGITLVAPPSNPTLSSNCTVRSNRLYRNEMAGIEVAGRNNLVEGNEIWGTVQCHPTLVAGEGGTCPTGIGLDADGMRFFGYYHIIRGNYIHDIDVHDPANRDPHIDCFQTWESSSYEGGHNITFEKNRCINNNNGMFVAMIEGATDLIFKNNLFMFGTGGGLNINPSNGPNNHITIVNNLFIGNTTAILQSGCQIEVNCWPAAVVLNEAPYCAVKNNIFYDMLDHSVYIAGNSNTGLQAGKNIMYRSDGQPLISAELYNHANDFWGVDPKLVNPAASDYHLQASSPAIDTGYDLTGLVSDDYDNNSRPQGAGYDIGAFEYVGGGCVLPGDVNCDGLVNLADLKLVASDFGKTTGFNSRADTNSNGVVDIFDVVFVASRFT